MDDLSICTAGVRYSSSYLSKSELKFQQQQELLASNSNLICEHKQYYGKLHFFQLKTTLQNCSNSMIIKKGIIFPSRHICFMIHWEIVKLWITGTSAGMGQTKKIIPISLLKYKISRKRIRCFFSKGFFFFILISGLFHQIESKTVWFLFNNALEVSRNFYITVFTLLI